jgi:3-isopropylmalate dehydrogenase
MHSLSTNPSGTNPSHLNIVVLPGDGIGPEVTRQAVRVLQTVGDSGGVDFRIHEHAIGGAAIREYGTPLPEPTLQACLNADAVLLGAVGGPEFDNAAPQQRPEAGLLGIRRALGGFANLRPATFYAELAECSPLRPEVARGADILIVRELLGGLYFGEPRGISTDGTSTALNTMRYSEHEIERVVRIGFEQARLRRRKLTSVDKANVLETSRLWRDVVNRLAGEYPDITVDHVLVDSCAMYLVTQPARFDVIVTENLFGDILSDEAAALTGSLGMLPSATVGGSVDLYEPVHGSAPDIAGKDRANPLGAIATIAMMLRTTFGMKQEADDVDAAIVAVLRDGHRTADLQRGSGSITGTIAMGELVERAVADIVDRRCAYHAV